MRTILVADDEPNLRLLVTTTLGPTQFRLLEAKNGTDALNIARADLPDLAILDWMMPGMTGPDVTQRLREDPVTAGIPIVLLTAKAHEHDMELARVAGVDAYLIKPFSPLELLEVVDRLLGVV